MTAPYSQSEGAQNDADEFVEFRRGFDNSHDNRMMTGSYSRYLMTTGMLPEHLFMETFYGSMPALGVALNSVERAQQLEQRHARTRHASPQRRLCQSRHRTYSSSGTHRLYNEQAANHGSNQENNNRNTNNDYANMGDVAESNTNRPQSVRSNMNTFTGTMNSTLPREMDLLASDTLHALNTDRTHRRINRKLVNRESDPNEVDFVYYNHNSKGCFIPREPVNKDALLLHYDDLYDFGDGTRFAAERNFHFEPHQATRNPHAAPPKTFAETQYLLHSHCHQHHSDNIDLEYNTQEQELEKDHQSSLPPTTTTTTNKQHGQLQQPHAQSLRTATSIDPNKLHCSQFRSVKSIEDVLASSAITPEEHAKRQTTVQHIRRAVNDGKISVNELAPSMKAMLESTIEAENANAHDIVPDTDNEGAARHEVSRLRYTKPFTRTTTPSVYVY